MQDKPLVSVIMNCFNSDEFLRESIESVINQTYKNWELIFWDNQSTDNSANIAKSYNDSRIKYFYAPKFAPLYGARNYAVKEAKGDFIAFLDCDDLWKNDKLEKQISLMHNGDFGLCYTNFYIMGQNKNKKLFVKTQPSGYIFKHQIANYSIGILTVMISKKAYDNIEDKFDSSLNFPGDYDLFIRLLKNEKACYIDEPLAYYRASNANSISNTKRLDNIKEVKVVLKKLKNMYSDKDILKRLDEAKAIMDIKEILFSLKDLNTREILRILRDMSFKDAFSLTVLNKIISKILRILRWYS